MRDKKNLRLAIICVTILIGLVCIQVILIKNTYALTKANYLNDVKKSTKQIINLPIIESIEDSIFNLAVDLSTQYASEEKPNKKDYLKKIKFKIDSLKEINNLKLEQEINTNSLPHFKLRFHVTQLVFKNNKGIADTLLSNNEAPIIYLGNAFKDNKHSFNLNVSEQYSNNDVVKNENSIFSTLWVKTSIDVNIIEWKKEVLKRMSTMLILAVLLLTAVLFLFFWIFKSLIKQKKIAEVKSDLANNIAHELRTPIASLEIIVKTLKNKSIINDEPKLNETLNSLDRQNKRLQNTIDKVLESSFKKSENINFEPINPTQFLEELIADFKNESHQLIPIISLPANITVNTDKHQLERIIQNLLENAIKYSPHKKQIELHSTIKNKTWEINIKDFGIGISSKNQPYVFDKFYRVSQGNQHNTKGLGLGLYLSKNLAQQLGATLSVNSKIKQGSTFTLKIPIV